MAPISKKRCGNTAVSATTTNNNTDYTKTKNYKTEKGNLWCTRKQFLLIKNDTELRGSNQFEEAARRNC